MWQQLTRKWISYLSTVQDEQGKKVDTYSFKYILPEAVKKKDKGKEKEKESKKGKGEDAEAYKEAIRDAKISWLAKLPADSKEAQVDVIFFQHPRLQLTGFINILYTEYIPRTCTLSCARRWSRCPVSTRQDCRPLMLPR